MNWLNFQRIFKALNYDFKHVQIDVKANADALEAGTVVGSVAYTTSGSQLSSYWKETEIRTDVKVVNPCDDEVAKLKAAGLAVVDVDPKGAFAKDVGPKMLKGVPILFAYNARADLPEDVGLQDGQGVLRQEGRAGEDRLRLRRHGQGLHRPAEAGHQRQSVDGGASRASPSS